MSKRGELDMDSAFSMFLDPACNAFGGIVFIALLLCVLLQLSERAGDTAAIDAANQQSQAEHADLTAEVARLLAIRQTQLQEIGAVGKTTDNMIIVQFADLKSREEAARRIFDKFAALTARQSALDVQIEQLRAKLADLDQRLLDAQSRAGKLSGDTVRFTQKQHVAVLLSGGRLAPVYRYGADARAINLNGEDVEAARAERDGKPRLYCRLKPNHGIAVDDTPQFEAQVAEMLAPFRAESHSLAVAVWPDSYPQFELLRRKLLRYKMSYFLLLMEKDQAAPVASDIAPRETGGAITGPPR